jgi:hypothetical protein
MARQVPLAVESLPAARFAAIGPDDVPPEFFGLSSYEDPVGRVTRREAVQVPAVKRGRDLIAGTLGTIPMDLIDPSGQPSMFSDLLRQPERGIPRAVTFARTAEDMLYDGVAWWLVTETGWHGYPTKVVRLESGVDVIKQARQYVTKMGHHGQAIRYDDDFDLIRFDSANDPLLVAGARAIRTHIALDRAVNNYSNGNQPLDYFTPAENQDDPDDEDLNDIVDAWIEARRQRSIGYVPAALAYKTAGWNPEQLQLAAQRDHASKELATLMGLQAERVNVSVTSRTYSNIQQDRQEFIDFTLNLYALPIAERLSMNDVTPRGYEAKWRWAEFLRTDDQTRMSIAVSGKNAGVLDVAESRRYFDPALPIAVVQTPAANQESADVQ